MHAFPQIFLYTNLNKVFPIKKKKKEKSDKCYFAKMINCMLLKYQLNTQQNLKIGFSKIHSELDCKAEDLMAH